MQRSLSVVIPAYNEEQSVGDVVRVIANIMAEADIECEIIVVDDGSSDGTARCAEESAAVVLRHTSNRGYGAALKTGIAAAKHEVICITDADGSYPVERIPDLLAELDHADMVVGARIGKSVAIPLVRKPAKWFLNRLANFVTQAKIPDLNSGLRLFRRDAAMQYFHILSDQFSFTTTITMAMHCDKYAVSYIPIDYNPRIGKSKIVPWDAATFTVLILRIAMFFRPLRVFLPCALLFLAYAVIKGFWDMAITGDRNISVTSAIALLGAIQFTLIGMLGDAIGSRLRYMANLPYSAIRPRHEVRHRKMDGPSPINGEQISQSRTPVDSNASAVR